MREIGVIALIAIIAVLLAKSGRAVTEYEFKKWLQEREQSNRLVRLSQ
jgi:hypothetical protein